MPSEMHFEKRSAATTSRRLWLPAVLALLLGCDMGQLALYGAEGYVGHWSGTGTLVFDDGSGPVELTEQVALFTVEDQGRLTFELKGLGVRLFVASDGTLFRDGGPEWSHLEWGGRRYVILRSPACVDGVCPPPSEGTLSLNRMTLSLYSSALRLEDHPFGYPAVIEPGVRLESVSGNVALHLELQRD